MYIYIELYIMITIKLNWKNSTRDWLKVSARIGNTRMVNYFNRKKETFLLLQ